MGAPLAASLSLSSTVGPLAVLVVAPSRADDSEVRSYGDGAGTTRTSFDEASVGFSSGASAAAAAAAVVGLVAPAEGPVILYCCCSKENTQGGCVESGWQVVRWSSAATRRV